MLSHVKSLKVCMLFMENVSSFVFDEHTNVILLGSAKKGHITFSKNPLS